MTMFRVWTWFAILIKTITASLLLFAVVVLISNRDLPATAAIFQQQEAPGQILTQSRSSLKDINGQNWQVICFRRQRADGPDLILIRLVGFPGQANLRHPQNLEIKTALGDHWFAVDRTDLIGPAQERPGNVGQYDLEPILADLKPEIPTRLVVTLDTDSAETLELRLTPGILREWQQVSAIAD